MRICFVSQSASRLGYGIFPIIVGTTQALSELGHVVDVAAVRDEFSSIDLPLWGSVPVATFRRRGPASLFYAPGLSDWFKGEQAFDILALQGVWAVVNATASRHARSQRAPIVMTPQGMLDTWAMARSRTKKWLAGLAYANHVLRAVDCFHVNSESEAAAVRKLGYRAPIAIIPNGVELPVRSRAEPGEQRTLVFLGRLHIKKGIRELVAAWNEVGHSFPAWRLVIAGPDEMGLQRELISAAGRSNITFAGEVFGEKKVNLLRSAQAFVLPSFSEGFPMAVLEAWSHGLPVVMTPACNIPKGFSSGAALSTEPNVAAIVGTLRRLLTLSDREREQMGDNGRNLVEREYSWTRVARELEAVYGWLRLRRGAPPPSVHFA